MTFTQLAQTEKIALFEKVSKTTKLDPTIIEKDWWVTAVLRRYFAEQMLEICLNHDFFKIRRLTRLTTKIL
jgi:hypothetical protein